MSNLPTISGTGFLLSPGIELKFSKAGVAYARLPLVFKRSKKTDNGWETQNEIIIEGTVFGALAESLAEQMPERGDVHVTGEIYTEEYEGKTSTRMFVRSAWPAKEDRSSGRAPVHAGAKSDGDFPF